MKDTVYLILTRNGVRELRKKSPTLGKGEYAVRLDVQVPDAAFLPRPIALASVVVPAEALVRPEPVVQVVAPPDPVENVLGNVLGLDAPASLGTPQDATGDEGDSLGTLG